MNPNHLLHHQMVEPTPIQRERLQSWQPLVPAAHKLLSELSEMNTWAEQWNDLKMEHKKLWKLIRDLPQCTQGPAPDYLAWVCQKTPAWVRLNCLHTSVGRFRSSMYKWGLAPTSICKSGKLDQTAIHVILDCLLHHDSRGYHEMLAQNITTSIWKRTPFHKKKLNQQALFKLHIIVKLSYMYLSKEVAAQPSGCSRVKVQLWNSKEWQKTQNSINIEGGRYKVQEGIEPPQRILTLLKGLIRQYNKQGNKLEN